MSEETEYFELYGVDESKRHTFSHEEEEAHKKTFPRRRIPSLEFSVVRQGKRFHSHFKILDLMLNLSNSTFERNIMSEMRRIRTPEEIAELHRKSHEQVVAEVAEEMGRKLVENRRRALAERYPERKPLATLEKREKVGSP